jgi:hypothetical protein
MYPRIGEPLSEGAVQAITTFVELTVVVGVRGVLGTCAAKIAS